MVVYIFNPSIPEIETGTSLRLRTAWPLIEISQDCIMKPCFSECVCVCVSNQTPHVDDRTQRSS